MIKKTLTVILLAAISLSCLSVPVSATSVPTYDCMGVKYDIQMDITSIFDGLIAVEKSSKWGFTDINGELVIPCQYSEVSTFNNGCASVRLNNKWGVIDTTGKYIIEAQFTNAPKFINGIFYIWTGIEYLQFDQNGNEINPKNKYPGYDDYAILSTNYIAVAKYIKDENGSVHGIRWGIIDDTGKELIPPQYPSSGYGDVLAPTLINENGIFAFVQDISQGTDAPNNLCGGLVDKNGNIILPFEYECYFHPPGMTWFAPYFSDELALVQSTKDGTTSYIDRNGKIIFTLSQKLLVFYTSTLFTSWDMKSRPFNFNEGMCRIVSGGKWGFIDKTGKTIVVPQYDEVSNYINGYAAVNKSGEMGFIDKKGTVIVPPIYDINPVYFYYYIYEPAFKNGLAAVSKNGKCGVVDSTGKILLPLIYDTILSYNFNDGLFMVKKGRKYGVFDSSGKTVLPLIYDAMPSYDPENALFIVKKVGNYGFVNKDNKVVISIKYQSVAHFINNMARVETGYQYGYIDKSGKVVVPIKYYSLSNIKDNRIYAAEKSGVRYILDTAGRVILKTITGKIIG